MAAALVLELDVLLDLSGLAADRRRADWNAVGAQLDRVDPYPSVPGGLATLELVEWVQELGPAVGILTDLPGPLAERLVERFALDPNVLLDASAGYAAPPRPDSLAAIAEALAATPAETLLVGAKPPHFLAAAQAGVASIAPAGPGRAT